MSEDMPHRMPDRWTWSFLRTSIAERLAMVYPNLSWSALLYPNMSWSAWWPIRVGLVSLLYPNMSWSAWWPILGVRSWCPILEIRWPILEIRWPILSSRFGYPGDRSWWPIRMPPVGGIQTSHGNMSWRRKAQVLFLDPEIFLMKSESQHGSSWINQFHNTMEDCFWHSIWQGRWFWPTTGFGLWCNSRKLS